jgi:hypothetical protein
LVGSPWKAGIPEDIQGSGLSMNTRPFVLQMLKEGEITNFEEKGEAILYKHLRIYLGLLEP